MTGQLLDQVVAAAGLAVHGAAAVDAADAASTRDALVREGVPGLLASQDPTLWGAAAEAGARTQLAFLDTHRTRELLPQLAELRAELTDLDRIVLAAAGAPALAAAAIARTLGLRLTVLDTTDPAGVRRVLRGDPRRTLLVVAGPSVETDAYRRAFLRAFLDAGMTAAEAGRHTVVVAPPGSPLAGDAREAGAYLLPATPAAGTFAALGPYALTGPALAGADVAELLDQAAALLPALRTDDGNPGLALGAALAAAATGGRDTIALVGDGSGLEALGGWVEQLLSRALGKDGVGVLPVVVEHPDSPGAAGPGVLTVSFGGALPAGAVPGGGIVPDLAVNGPLGAQFLAWEYAAAIAARVLGVNPFDGPASELDLTPGDDEPSFVEGAVQVFTGSGAPDLAGVLRDLLAGDGYLAVQAFLDPESDAVAEALRPLLATAAGLPVTFGWGARSRHATGRLHTAGPPIGAFLQLTGADHRDLAVPGRPYSFGSLQTAQAAADRRALAAAGRPVLRLHLTDRDSGLRQVLVAAETLQPRPSP